MRSTSSLATFYLDSVSATQSHRQLEEGCRSLREALDTLSRRAINVEPYLPALLEVAEETLKFFVLDELARYPSFDELRERTRAACDTCEGRSLAVFSSPSFTSLMIRLSNHISIHSPPPN